MAQAGIRNSLWLLLFSFLTACNPDGKRSEQNNPPKPDSAAVVVPAFDADSAYRYTEIQTSFGPRVPNTEAHIRCGDYLSEFMKRYADTVIVQAASVKAFDGTNLKIRNIIGSFRPELKRRILLCAHWDSRPFADQDTVDRDRPIEAANDGAASCAVLMEVCRQLHLKQPAIGVDIIFFDAEDYGQPDDSKLARVEDSYCLGSQYWSKNLHVPGYNATYGILLDMVGAENPTFFMEGTSLQYASSVLNRVWENALHAGYSDYFIFKESAGIIDDHYYINLNTGIPVIDIVHRDPATPSHFWKYWHTHHDTMDKIRKSSLKAVGQTVLLTIFREGVS